MDETSHNKNVNIKPINAFVPNETVDGVRVALLTRMQEALA